MQEFFINKAGAYLRYQDLPGDETPILFIHGLGCAGSFDYPEVAAQKSLTAHRRILIDLLGSGYSDKPSDFSYLVTDHAECLRELVESLKLEHVVLVGHSLGGPVAIELAQLCSGVVQQLILTESNLDPSTEGDVSYQIARVSEEYFLREGYEKLIQESRESGNAMWAGALKNCFPPALYQLSQNAARGGTTSWRNLLYDLVDSKLIS